MTTPSWPVSFQGARKVCQRSFRLSGAGVGASRNVAVLIVATEGEEDHRHAVTVGLGAPALGAACPAGIPTIPVVMNRHRGARRLEQLLCEHLAMLRAQVGGVAAPRGTGGVALLSAPFCAALSCRSSVQQSARHAIWHPGNPVSIRAQTPSAHDRNRTDPVGVVCHGLARVAHGLILSGSVGSASPHPTLVAHLSRHLPNVAQVGDDLRPRTALESPHTKGTLTLRCRSWRSVRGNSATVAPNSFYGCTSVISRVTEGTTGRASL